MGVEFKDRIMLHGLREVKCLWEVDELGRREWWKGNKVARWERQEESGEVVRWNKGEQRGWVEDFLLCSQGWKDTP